LCKDELDREILVEFFHYQKNGSHRFLGSFLTNLEQLKTGLHQHPVTLKGSTIGHSIFKDIAFVKKHTFLDYIFGGCEVSLAVAIDFTLSNGDPKNRNSLHYFDPQRN